ncbi:MAG: HAD domain-containing protein [Sporichthyaceae bacterium]
MSLPPLWLLDVDGVLNAVTGTPDRQVWDDWQSGSAVADGVPWPIWFSPTVQRTVRRLHEEGLAEVRWLTTWGDNANGELRQLLDLPALRVVGAHLAAPAPVDTFETSHGEAVAARTAAGEWWKLQALRELWEREGERPLVWTDDDLARFPAAGAWAERHVPARLLLAPRRNLGLTPRLLAEVERFCERHRVEPPE